jgi:hypothetical protein
VRDKTRRRVTKLQLHPVGRFAFDEVQVWLVVLFSIRFGEKLTT